MELSDYRAFATLSETLHFGRSARTLHVSPSALSRTVQRIEGELGMVLVLRDKRNVALSRAGEVFAEHARKQLEAHEHLLERLAEEAAAPTGELRIACTVTACHSILPHLLSDCRRYFPRIHLRLSTCDAVEAMARLQRDESQVAVVPKPETRDEALLFARLAHTTLCFIAPASSPEIEQALAHAPLDLGGVPLIMPEGGLERTMLDRFLRARGIAHPNIYAEVRGNEAIIAMVSLGCGVGLVPDLVWQGSPLRDAIVRLDTESPGGFAVGLCAKRRSLSRRAVRALFELA